MSVIIERYASAVRSTNLRSDVRSVASDTDVLGSMGLAARDFPLAVALQRLFCGDNKAAAAIAETLADDAWREARAMRVKLNRVEAYDMAQACLAWHRDGVCKPCGGHGKLLIPGTKTLGNRDCKDCRGVGKMPFERQFPGHQRELAGWLVAHMEQHQSKAGPEAMKRLSAHLSLRG